MNEEYGKTLKASQRERKTGVDVSSLSHNFTKKFSTYIQVMDCFQAIDVQIIDEFLPTDLRRRGRIPWKRPWAHRWC